MDNIKTFEFEDGSKLSTEILEDKLVGLTLQARHLGKEFKVTSAKVVLSPDKMAELINWVADKLLEE